MLRLNREQADAIRQHAAREYPSECCGVLLGRAEGEVKRVREAVVLPNVRIDPQRAVELLPLKDPEHESARNRYFIDPFDLLRVAKDGRARGLEILGYYHSHPDQPAQPSAHDHELAWPGYSYLIVEVRGGEPQQMTCWRLAGDGRAFEPEPLEWVEP
jgi:proteasome lid subunit RPN8/RPN11